MGQLSKLSFYSFNNHHWELVYAGYPHNFQTATQTMQPRPYHYAAKSLQVAIQSSDMVITHPCSMVPFSLCAACNPCSVVPLKLYSTQSWEEINETTPVCFFFFFEQHLNVLNNGEMTTPFQRRKD